LGLDDFGKGDKGLVQLGNEKSAGACKEGSVDGRSLGFEIKDHAT